MRAPFVAGYSIAALFIIIALLLANFEFMVYAGATLVLLGILHFTDRMFGFSSISLWLFCVWMILHILGGMLRVGDSVLYSYVLVPIVSEPYSILKYDQVVHVFCYFVIALLMWSVVSKVLKTKSSFAIAATITVLAATGVGGLNEIIEFSTTIFFETNVGGYENTALDIVMNLIGATLAVPLMRKSTGF